LPSRRLELLEELRAAHAEAASLTEMIASSSVVTGSPEWNVVMHRWLQASNRAVVLFEQLRDLTDAMDHDD